MRMNAIRSNASRKSPRGRRREAGERGRGRGRRHRRPGLASRARSPRIRRGAGSRRAAAGRRRHAVASPAIGVSHEPSRVGEKGAFGGEPFAGRGVVDRRQQRRGARSSPRAARCRSRPGRWRAACPPTRSAPRATCASPSRLQPGHGEEGRLGHAVLELLQPGLDVAAELDQRRGRGGDGAAARAGAGSRCRRPRPAGRSASRAPPGETKASRTSSRGR